MDSFAEYLSHDAERPANSQVEHLELPVILTVHLIRHGHDGVNAARLDSRFEFPDRFDASRLPGGKGHYVLTCVIAHTGNPLFGHYLAFLLDVPANTWHEFNDDKVTEVAQSQAIDANFEGKRCAYLLVYVNEEELSSVFRPVRAEAVPETQIFSKEERRRSFPGQQNPSVSPGQGRAQRHAQFPQGTHSNPPRYLSHHMQSPRPMTSHLPVDTGQRTQIQSQIPLNPTLHNGGQTPCPQQLHANPPVRSPWQDRNRAIGFRSTLAPRYVPSQWEQNSLRDALPRFMECSDGQAHRAFFDEICGILGKLDDPNARAHWTRRAVRSWFHNNDPRPPKDIHPVTLKYGSPSLEASVAPPLPGGRFAKNPFGYQGVRPFDDSSPYVLLHVTKRCENEIRTKVGLGFDNDKGTLIAFLCSLPLGWLGCLRHSRAKNPEMKNKENEKDKEKEKEKEDDKDKDQGRFSWCLKISLPRSKKPKCIFKVYFNANFSAYSVYSGVLAWEVCVGAFFHSHETLLEDAHYGSPTAFYLPLRDSKDPLDSDHPFSVLGNRIYSDALKDHVDPVLLHIYSHEIPERLEARRARNQNFTHFLDALDELREKYHASITITATKTPGLRLHQMSESEWLSRLVCVFPHAVTMLNDNPNAVIGDGTFSILYPYILELLVVDVSNESLPIALCVTTAEDESSLQNLYDCTIEQLRLNNVDAGKLEHLPLISDQGKAFQAFAKNRKLNWKLCHRHIIQNFGPSSLIGSWVARILRCCSKAEYLREKKVIMSEISGTYPPDGPRPKKLNKLLMMLGDKEQKEKKKGSPLSRRRHWARWRRISSPTTSNSIESIHAKLNKLKHSREVFLRRLAKVMKYCADRYKHRNDKSRRKHRARNRFWSDKQGCWGEMMRNHRNRETAKFYEALNSNDSLGEENGKLGWRFPEHPNINAIRRFRELKINYVDFPDQLPESRWRPTRSAVYPDPLSVLFGEFDSDGEPFPAGSIDWDDGYVDTAWRITFSVRPMLSRHVPHDWSRIIVQVSAIGRELFGDAVGEVSTDVESAWRQLVYLRLGITP
jgi:hypothetical protein